MRTIMYIIISTILAVILYDIIWASPHKDAIIGVSIGFLIYTPFRSRIRKAMDRLFGVKRN